MTADSVETGNLESLARRIERDLEEQHLCVVFEDDVERCWPNEKGNDLTND